MTSSDSCVGIGILHNYYYNNYANQSDRYGTKEITHSVEFSIDNLAYFCDELFIWTSYHYFSE